VLLAALAVGCVPGDDTSSTETASETTGTMDTSAGPTSYDTSSESDSEPGGSDSTGSTTIDPTDTETTTIMCEPMCVDDAWDDCDEPEPQPCEFGCDDEVGCLPGCTPGEVKCLGDNIVECKDGVFEVIENCDPMMGFSCEEAACTGPCEPSALTDNTNEGCDFYPTVTANILDSEGTAFAVRVANTANYPAEIQIHRGQNLVLSGQVESKAVRTFVLPWIPELQATDNWSASRVVEDGAYRLRASQPVVVYQFNAQGGSLGPDDTESNDASMLLPVHILDTDYTVVSTQSWPDPNSEMLLPGFYAVTATEDNTEVMLDTPGAVVAHPGDGVSPDGTGVVSLDAGDVLEVFSSGTNNNPGDLTGTRVLATKPVQVIGGHMCSGVPTPGDNTCNHLEETILPPTWLGIEYLVVPPATGGAVDNAREQEVYIVAMEDGTNIEVKPDLGVWDNVKAGQKIVVPLTNQAMVVSSSKPVSVFQVMASPGAGDWGGPAMLQVHPIPNWSANVEFALPEGYEHVYVNLLVKHGGDMQPKVNLKGYGGGQETEIKLGYTHFQDTDLWYQRYKLSPADVEKVLILGSMAQISVSVYGESVRGSAWYPAGLKLHNGGNDGLPKLGMLK